jgi:Ca-activated chloride channel family protein
LGDVKDFRSIFIVLIVICLPVLAVAQSGRMGGYSESVSKSKGKSPASDIDVTETKADEDTIKVETDLVTIPVRVTTRGQKPLTDLKQSEFRIFENGEQQKVAYFSNIDQPFTVALLLDMSYSTVFKLNEIQAAALLFVSQLRENDKVTVIAFDQKPRVLCQPTSNRKVLKLAIEGAKVGSGTSLYDALDLAINKQFAGITGRKAIVLLSDGVDTFSGKSSAKDIIGMIQEEDLLFYPLRYDTFDDVRDNRRKDAEVRYDEDDRPYIYERPPGKGEREIDYAEAREFLETIAERSGGRTFKVSSTTNLTAAFARIADELRKTYSLGYYPTEERRPGAEYTLKVRIYRPNLIIRTRESYTVRSN